MKKKIIILLVCVLLAGTVIGRIVYVNVTYPYAGFRDKKQNEEATYLGVNFKVVHSELYGKEKWLEHIGKLNILEEAKAIVQGLVEDGEFIGYNPNDYYEVVVLEIEAGKDLNISSLERNFNVVRSLNDTKEAYDSYYSGKLQEYYVKDEGQSDMIKIYRVYIVREQAETLYLQSLEFGNNTMIKLEPVINR